MADSTHTIQCIKNSDKRIVLYAFDDGHYALSVEMRPGPRQFGWFDGETMAEMIQWFLNPVDDEKEN